MLILMMGIPALERVPVAPYNSQNHEVMLVPRVLIWWSDHWRGGVTLDPGVGVWDRGFLRGKWSGGACAAITP
jgi:hypothetical protein